MCDVTKENFRLVLKARIQCLKNSIGTRACTVGDAIDALCTPMCAVKENPETAGIASTFGNKVMDPELEILIGRLTAYVEIYNMTGFMDNA